MTAIATTTNINNSAMIDPVGFATTLPAIPDALALQTSGTNSIARQALNFGICFICATAICALIIDFAYFF